MTRNERTCIDWTAELVECARRFADETRTARERQPARELRAHLAGCVCCRERWEAEILLTAHLATVRSRTAAFRSRESQGEALMRDFVHRHKVRVIRARGLALGAAAAVVMAVLLGNMAGHARKKPARNILQAAVYDSGDILSMDASALSSDDFVAVPYTPPLAQGEMVRVVHAELYPDALASMGVQVDPAWAERLPADVVIGEDGLPRAVRLTENTSF
jgi:hypothetical protein